MGWIALLGIITFISIFINGYQLLKNGQMKKEIKELKGDDK